MSEKVATNPMTPQTIKEFLTKFDKDGYISVREHFNALQKAQDERINAEFRCMRDAVKKATKALERRLKLLNEFRAQTEDESKKYATVTSLGGLREMVDMNTTQVARLYGGLAVVGLVGVANLVKLFFT